MDGNRKGEIDLPQGNLSRMATGALPKANMDEISMVY
jgi:hypothetical protein